MALSRSPTVAACGEPGESGVGEVPTWRPIEPALRVGVVEGDAAYQLYRVADDTLLPLGWAVLLAGGQLAMASQETVIPKVEGETARQPFTVLVGSDTLARYAGTRFVRASAGAGRVRLASTHFTPRPQMDARGDLVYAASGEERAIDALRSDGALERTIRWDGASLDVQPGDFERYRASVVAENPARVDAVFDDIPVEPTFPALAGLHAAADGSLWVEEYSRPGDPPGQRWLVFREGELAERVDLPDRTHLLEAGDGYVVLRERDELDVERVAVYRR